MAPPGGEPRNPHADREVPGPEAAVEFGSRPPGGCAGVWATRRHENPQRLKGPHSSTCRYRRERPLGNRTAPVSETRPSLDASPCWTVTAVGVPISPQRRLAMAALPAPLDVAATRSPPTEARFVLDEPLENDDQQDDDNDEQRSSTDIHAWDPFPADNRHLAARHHQRMIDGDRPVSNASTVA